jgi:hypothetical protein
VIHSVEEQRKFGIPLDYLKKPISPDVLGWFGIDRNANQADLYMNPVLIEGNSYGGGTFWSVTARSGHADDTEKFVNGNEDVYFGGIHITSELRTKIEPPQILEITEDWIRNSENTEFAPGRTIPLPVSQDMLEFAVCGLILVRAANFR